MNLYVSPVSHKYKLCKLTEFIILRSLFNIVLLLKLIITTLSLTMLCPEGLQVQHDTLSIENKEICNKEKLLPTDGPGSIERNSFKNPKTWKKSITNFFRNQLRSTKSNEGDSPSESNQFDDKDISLEQKWQSLGKMFRRQSLADHCNKKSPNQLGEGSSQNKRLNVRKALSTYFGKNEKSPEN